MDFDYPSPFDQDEQFPSSQIPATDFVGWQNSQVSSCPALNTLMREVSTIPQRPNSHRNVLKSTDTLSFVSSQPVATTSRSLTRTNSRPRLGRHSDPMAREHSNTPDLNLFNKKDPNQFLDLVRVVAERVDENAGMKTLKSGELSGTKRKVRVVTGNTVMKAGKPRLSTVPDERTKSSRTVEKQREDRGRNSTYDSRIHGALPHLSSSASTSASSSSLRSVNTSVSMDVDIADTSMSANMMDIDEAQWCPPSTHHLPAPDKHFQTRATSTTINPKTSIPDDTTTFNPVIAPPRVQPLAQQLHRPHQPTRSAPQVQPSTRVHPHPRPKQPPSSQTAATRPPTLGMRRLHTASLHPAPAIHQPLPTRQKAFKPPLLPGTQPPHTQQQSQPLHFSPSTQSSPPPKAKPRVLSHSHSTWLTPVSTQSAPAGGRGGNETGGEGQSRPCTPTSRANLDPDTSYEEEWSIDGAELEKVMSKIDGFV